MIGLIDTPSKAARCAAFEAAQAKAHEAVRKAQLTRTHCESCGLIAPELRFHHDSYDHPLAIVALCPRCHDARHRELGWGYAGGPDGWQVEGPHWTPGPGVPPLDEPVELDFAMHEVEPVTPIVANPWLERRRHGFGASELAPLLVALGRVTPAEIAALPKYLREQASSILRRKAFPGRERKAGGAASRGQKAERVVLEAWRRADAEAAGLINITHESVAPRSWFPLVDRHCPRLTATPDGWASDVFGDDVGLEVKTTVEPIGQTPWWWLTQVHAQNAVGAYERSLVIVGEGWAHWREDRRVRPRALSVPRDEAQIERIRAACRDGWARVEEMRAERKAA